MNKHPGRIITQYQVTGIFAKTHKKVRLLVKGSRGLKLVGYGQSTDISLEKKIFFQVA